MYVAYVVETVAVLYNRHQIGERISLA